MMEIDKIICGHNVDVLAGFPDACIDLTVTSPPYDNLRTYNGYNFDFEGVAQQLYRVTKAGGVVVWVVGDATVNGSETGTSFRQALYFMECGFNLHDTMIYQKAGFRFPDAARYNPTFEYMFIFSKGAPLKWNPLRDKKNIYVGSKVARQSQNRNIDGSLTPNSAWNNNKNKTVNEYGKRDNVWIYGIGGEQELGDHPAVFPEALVQDHIISWSNPGDVVLDPFVGSGTTAKMAKQNGRHWIGIDISPEYCKLAEKRVMGANVPLFNI
jgi:site-specific DNA-methyltransferase (adenine-specific)